MQNEELVQKAIEQTFGKEDRFRAVKDYLYQVKDGKRRVKLIEDRISYRMESMGAHGINFDEYIPGSHDYRGSAVENAVIALSGLENERKEAEKAYADAKVAVSDLISRLRSVNQQAVITRRYIDGESWDKIALDMDMTVRNVQKLHGRALPILQEILTEEQAA